MFYFTFVFNAYTHEETHFTNESRFKIFSCKVLNMHLKTGGLNFDISVLFNIYTNIYTKLNININFPKIIYAFRVYGNG